MTIDTDIRQPLGDYVNTVEFTRGLVEAILGDHPNLHFWGFGVDYHRERLFGVKGDAGNGQTVEEARAALMTDASIETIHAGLAWTRKQHLKFRTATDETVPTTYWFKHVVEAAIGRYVSNGQGAVIAIAADLPVECCELRRGAHACGVRYSPGIRLTKRSWKALDKAVRGVPASTGGAA